MKNFLWAVGSVIVAVVLGLFVNGPTSLGAITSPASNLDFLQLSQGLQLPAGPSVSTAQWGTQIQGFENGSKFGGTACYVLAASQTISASSTATVDCQASSVGAPGVALPNVLAGDRVFASLGTTSPTTFQGLSIIGASASSTAGFVTLNVFNGTGATFTWTAAASSSVQYLDIR